MKTFDRKIALRKISEVEQKIAHLQKQQEEARSTLVNATKNTQPCRRELRGVRRAWVVAPQITVTGVCPGEVTLSITGGAPTGTGRLVGSFALGSTTLPSGDVCAGTNLNLENAFQLLGTGRLDLDGAGIWPRNATASDCGMLLQAVDDTTCELSNVTNLP